MDMDGYKKTWLCGFIAMIFKSFFSLVLLDQVIQGFLFVQDSIVCDSAVIGAGSEVRSCIVGRGLSLPEGSSHHNQILLDSDRMMEV